MRKTGNFDACIFPPVPNGSGREWGQKHIIFLTLLKESGVKIWQIFADESGGIRKLPVSAIFFLCRG